MSSGIVPQKYKENINIKAELSLDSAHGIMCAISTRGYLHLGIAHRCPASIKTFLSISLESLGRVVICLDIDVLDGKIIF